jgi:hypothetical protein
LFVVAGSIFVIYRRKRYRQNQNANPKGMSSPDFFTNIMPQVTLFKMLAI